MRPARSNVRRLLADRFLGVLLPLLAWAAVTASPQPANACTSILVSRGASADGSVMITYSCDDAGCYCDPGHHAGRRPQAGRDDRGRSALPTDKGPRGKIPQVPHTYKRAVGPDERAPACHVGDHLRRPAGGGSIRKRFWATA